MVLLDQFNLTLLPYELFLQSIYDEYKGCNVQKIDHSSALVWACYTYSNVYSQKCFNFVYTQKH